MQNDIFVKAMMEYSVGEEAASNGWATLVGCVCSEFTDGLEESAVKAFLRTQETLYKEEGGVLSAAYRSAKSTLVNGVRYGVNINQGKTAVADATKAAKKALEEPADAYTTFEQAVAKAFRAYNYLGKSELGHAQAYICGLFDLAKKE